MRISTMKQLIKKLSFNKSLLDILVCPVTKDSLTWDKEKKELISKKARLAYPIVNGIPILIKEKARKL